MDTLGKWRAKYPTKMASFCTGSPEPTGGSASVILYHRSPKAGHELKTTFYHIVELWGQLAVVLSLNIW